MWLFLVKLRKDVKSLYKKILFILCIKSFLQKFKIKFAKAIIWNAIYRINQLEKLNHLIW